MDKHANTIFPEDTVRKIAKVKTAAEEIGSVRDVDADMGLAKVKWSSGETTWVDLVDVEKV